MSFLTSIWQDLKSKKLVPVAIGLLVAIVAVPVVLSGSSSGSTGAGNVPPPVAPTGLPAVTQTTTPSDAKIRHSERDPFASATGASSGGTSGTGTTATTAPPQSSGSSPATGGGSTTTTGGTPVTSSGGSPGGGGSSGGGTSPVSSGGGGGNNPPTKIPTGPTKPTVPTLKSDQSYTVKLGITGADGGVNTIDPLERLTMLPAASDPRLVELGVLKGGSHVLFAVEPGTVVSGPGSCVPGPIDCEILELAQNQTESIGVRSNSGVVHMAMFAVTGITVTDHSSPAAAQKARRSESSAGRKVLNNSPLGALSLFRYDPGTGSVLDLRNLTLEG